MATIPASENEFPQVLLTEGAAPATPGTGLVVAYVKSDGRLYWKDDAGTEYAVADGVPDADAVVFDPTGLAVITGTDVQTALEEVDAAIGGGGIPATTVDAKGDLLVGTADDTVDNLTAGADGSFLQALASESTGLKWRAAPTAGAVILTSANYTGTASTTWGDVTGATVTITTLARRARVHVAGCCQMATNGDAVAFDIAIDGSRQGGTNGITGVRQASSGHRANFSFTYLTPVLSAGSHTIKLQSNRIVGSGTITIFAVSSDAALTFAVEETLLLA